MAPTILLFLLILAVIVFLFKNGPVALLQVIAKLVMIFAIQIIGSIILGVVIVVGLLIIMFALGLR